ncbi:MAG: putative immunity protein [Eubacteriales bacterium]
MKELPDTLNHQKQTNWAASCAAHVLIYFETAYPKDSRPRRAIDASRAWIGGEISVSKAREAAFEAHAAARDASREGNKAACAAARSAGHAAATAHVPGHAVHAAAYAQKAAALANADDAGAGNKEEQWQLMQLQAIQDNQY